jgi:DNA-binding response OmpR family regulator
MARILLVDDEATVRRIMQLGLSKAGHDVTTADNGESALDLVRRAEPDVLITDIEMPRMDGRKLCETLDAQLVERRFPIFLLTSLTDHEHRRWSGSVRDLHFIEKPVSLRMLLARIEACLADPTPRTGDA